MSVLFADLVGFTTLSEHRDPEQIRELLSVYFDRCRALIERHSGSVEKFIGDAVMAVWGTPIAREDDAERAVRTALALPPAVAALGAEAGMPDLQVRVGVLTGSAAVEIGAETEGMVLGDTVNTASRLQSIAAPGTVLVDDVTRAATDATILYEDAGTHQVKGREQPVRAWTAVHVAAGVGGAGRGVGLEAPFVGRAQELELIISAAEQCTAEGRARLVSVVGEAGHGKSRLLWEFEKYIDGIDEVVSWHQGRCLSYGEGVAYWALAEMIRLRAKIGEDESAERAREKLREAIAGYVTSERERRLIEPRLAHLLGLEERSAPDRADLFSGWRLFFERMAETEPVLLVFEDLQWADSGLLEFIDHLLEWSADYPIFILAFARPELSELRPQWGSTIALGRLDDEAMGDLLAGLVPGLPEELSARIRQRAEGVPLYAVETVRMLLNRGLLTQDGPRYAVSGDIAELDVPETLHALVAARLDGLDPAERSLLQDASVLGQSFSARGVAALSERPMTEAEALLQRLIAKQVLSYDDDEFSPDRGQFAFLQALMRTIAYGTLNRHDRKAKHLAAARFLQESWASETSEIAEVLASHFLDAAAADPDAVDAPKIRRSALETLAEAGRRAASLALGHEAQRAYDRATELAEDDGTRADLLEQAGRAAWLEADADSARIRLQAAREIYEALGRPDAVGSTDLVLSDIASQEADMAVAIEITEAARQRMPSGSRERATATAQLARWYLYVYEHERSLQVVDEALEIAESLESWELLADALATKGTVLHMLRRWHEGTAVLNAGLEIAREHDQPAAAVRAHNNLSNHLLTRGLAEEALSHLGQALELARGRGDRVWEGYALVEQGSALLALGRWDEAVELAIRYEAGVAPGSALSDSYLVVGRVWGARGEPEALAKREEQTASQLESEDVQVRYAAQVWRAMVAQEEGRHGEVLKLLREVASEKDPLWMRYGFFEAGRAHLAMDDLEGLERILAAAESLPPADLPPLPRAVAQAFRAILASRGGGHASAVAGLENAVDNLRSVGHPFELAWSLLEQGIALHRAGRPDEATVSLSEAREIYSGLGATLWIERVDQALQTESVPA